MLIADARLEPVLRDRCLHLGRGSNRTERVVLVRDGDPEHRHDRVADELLDGAAVTLEDDAKILEVAPHPCAQRLGIGRLAERGRADEVAEEDRDDLALLARRLRDTSAAPHELQKRASSAFSRPQSDNWHARSLRALGRPKPARAERKRSADATFPFGS